MANGESQLSADFQVFSKDLVNMIARAKELSTRFSDNAAADVTALANNAATLPSSPLTKLQWNQANALAADLIAFGENQAVATSWRRPIANGIGWAGTA